MNKYKSVNRYVFHHKRNMSFFDKNFLYVKRK